MSRGCPPRPQAAAKFSLLRPSGVLRCSGLRLERPRPLISLRIDPDRQPPLPPSLLVPLQLHLPISLLDRLRPLILRERHLPTSSSVEHRRCGPSPSLSGITIGRLPSTTAIHELVVSRSCRLLCHVRLRTSRSVSGAVVACGIGPRAGSCRRVGTLPPGARRRGIAQSFVRADSTRCSPRQKRRVRSAIRTGGSVLRLDLHGGVRQRVNRGAWLRTNLQTWRGGPRVSCPG